MNQGEKIKQLCDERGISVTQLATALEITAPGVYNLFKRDKIKGAQLKSIYEVINSFSKETLYSNNTTETMESRLKAMEEKYSKLNEVVMDMLNREAERGGNAGGAAPSTEKPFRKLGEK